MKPAAALLFFCGLLLVTGCVAGQNSRQIQAAAVSTEVRLIKYHVESFIDSLEDFTRRLYAKNPKYEQDADLRRKKIEQIFRGGPPVETYYARQPSHEVLQAAFALETEYPDRVYLLCLGMVKSIKEAYQLDDGSLIWSGMQVKLDRLQKLHYNLSQVNWRLRTYRDREGKLLFLTNEAGEDGYLNMGYEVIMTRILTRLQDYIYLRDGLPGKYIFSVSSFFLSILL